MLRAAPPLAGVMDGKRAARGALLGLEHALPVLPIQLGLIRALEFVPSGTRAQAVGACVASLSILLSGLILGLRVRHGIGDAIASEAESLGDYVPWTAILSTAILIALGGAIGFLTRAATILGVPESTMVTGGIARAVFASDAIVLPALFHTAVGVLLGLNARRWTLLNAIGGFALFVVLALTGGHFAQYTSFDPVVVRIWMVSFAAAAAFITGFAVSWWTKRLAFVEQCLIALFIGFSLYLVVSVGPKELLSASNVPEEQILVALILAPSIASIALLSVGASIAFLLFGGGRFDPWLRYESAVAIRYLKANRRDLFVSVVTVIAVLGVCLGVMALIVVLSVMSGFEDDLKRKILGAHAHIVLEKHGDDFLEYADVEEKVSKVSGVATAAAFVLGDAMVSSDVGLSGTLVKGIDPRNKSGTADLRSNMEKGALDNLLKPCLIPGASARMSSSGTSLTLTGSSAPAHIDGSQVKAAPPIDVAEPRLTDPDRRCLPGIVIGRELSKTLRAYVGDVVKLVSPVSEEIGPTGPHPKLRRFRIAGIFFSGMYEYDAKFTYVDLEEAQRFFGMRGKATGIEVKVSDVDETSRIAEEMKRRVGGHPYTVKDWRQMNKELFSALLLEKLAMFIILTFIILVASFLIVATLVMIVLEKGKEIAIMKSLGASNASVMKIFVVQGLIVGVGGALLGLLGGISICLLIEKFGVKLDQRIFYIERLPVVMDWSEIAAIAIAAVMISYLATIYPAMTAAKLRPVDGLRDD
jgi:ABC-type lipoprotein release transport system permease subunit